MTGIEKILVAYDGSEEARRALDYGIGLAKLAGAQLGVVSVVVVHAAHPARMSGVEPWDDDKVHEAELTDAVGVARAADLDVEVHRPHGDPAEKLIEVADEHGYDHIVLGHRHLGHVERLVARSVSAKVSADSSSIVTIVK